MTSALLAGPVWGRHGMVVSAHPLASQAGIRVLQEGGNAVDAAIATGLALAVVHPAAGNLGGGGFMLIHRADGLVTTIDFRERAPAAAREGMFLDPGGQLIQDANHEGYRAIGVPGTVAGFDLARERYGQWSWRALAAPAVELATRGFPLSWAMATEFAEHRTNWLACPAAARVFLKPDGSHYRAGETWKQPDLARTLRRLQRSGRREFYAGETARRIADDMRRHGGLITEADLRTYTAVERAPVHGTYRGWAVYSMGPPSSGGVALVEMLNVLEGFDLKAAGPQSAAGLHLLAETMRRAFADRARYLGDPESNPTQPVGRLISKAYAAQRRSEIHPERATPSDPSDVDDARESTETTHYSVVDAEGTAVSVTYTLEYSYGARLVADGLGFLYNNEMGDFNPQPGRTDTRGLIGTRPNLVAPGKRMLSSMTPTIVARDGRPVLVLGSPGGRTIINTVLQVLVNVIDFEMPLAEAVAAGRVHHQWLPDELVLERSATSPDTHRLLEARGHRLRIGGLLGRVMAIHIDPASGLRLGVADARDPDAAAVGY